MSDLISRAEAAEIFEAMLKTATDQKIKIGISRSWQQIKDLPSADRPKGGDLISRKEAIEALGEEPPVWCDEEYEIAERSQWRADVEAIKSVPSADRPRGRWTLLTEERPVDGYEIIATAYWPEYGDSTIAVGHIDRFDKWHLYSPTEGELIKGFEVIAWMPLPEPYKGGDDK